MQKNLTWKFSLIAALALLAVWAIVPPKDRLKLGLDLRGGTTLVYEVNVPEGQSVNTAIDQTIQVLQERVDPSGVRNLVWRRQGANRLEIQMPAAPEATAQRRSEYLKLKDQLYSHNLKRHTIETALLLDGPAREEKLASTAGQDAKLHASLKALALAFDAKETAGKPYAELQKDIAQAQEALSKLDQAAPKEQREALDKQIEALTDQSIDAAGKVVEADKAYNDAFAAVTAINVQPAEFERILAMPTRGVNPDNPKDREFNPRATALESFTARHTDKAGEIKEVVAAHERYEEKKGPLDDPSDLIALLRGSGVLEFRIAPSPNDLSDVEQYREQLATKGPNAGAGKPYQWFLIDKPENFAQGRTVKETQKRVEGMHGDPEGFFANLGAVPGGGMIAQASGGQIYMLLSDTKGSALTKKTAPDWQLASASQIPDNRSGLPAVGFNLNTVGAQEMGAMTAAHVNDPMAIVLDGRVISAPSINSKISGSGQITGGNDGFDPAELNYLISTLNAGSLQASLSDEPISQQTIGATFGQDNLMAGLKTLIWSLILVGGFMLVYYFFWGMVANVSLVLNLLFVIGVMSLFQATFTLPGIAGLVLTIGMAVDANVLIYERIREELERHADLRTAIRLGFGKALSTIVDANLTTMITCWVLYGLAPFDRVIDVFKTPADIKGFAVTLGIGVIINIFTGVFCTRVVIEIYMALMKPKKLPMLALVFSPARALLSPNIDWLGKKWIFIGFSTILAIAGIVGVFSRGDDFYDIEFRGGTQVTFQLAQGNALRLQDARERLTKVALENNLPNMTGDNAVVVTLGDTEIVTKDTAERKKGIYAKAFSIATLNDKPQIVSDTIKTAFADVLDTTLPLHFTDMGDLNAEPPPMSSLPRGRVSIVRSNKLGANIGLPQLTADVGSYVGGVAIRLENIEPTATVADVTQRITRMRQQPTYEPLGYRDFEVFGLPGTEFGRDAEGRPLYKEMVVVSRDQATNYLDAPDAFDNPEGLASTEWMVVRDALLRDTSLGSISNFSPQVSATMTRQALVAMALSWLAILAYVWFRFGDLRFGLGAIVALVHDVVIAVGLTALAAYAADSFLGHWLMLEPFRVNLSLVAATLTLIGFSVNDTIVVFDRIRENRGKLAFATPQIINDSINQTISRTVLTTGTFFIVVLLLYVLGGPAVHNFAFLLLVGTVVGTYSSIAIASPILLMGHALTNRTPATKRTVVEAKPVR